MQPPQGILPEASNARGAWRIKDKINLTKPRSKISDVYYVCGALVRLCDDTLVNNKRIYRITPAECHNNRQWRVSLGEYMQMSISTPHVTVVVL